MATETNLQWPVGRLIQELNQEHQMMKAWREGKTSEP